MRKPTFLALTAFGSLACYAALLLLFSSLEGLEYERPLRAIGAAIVVGLFAWVLFELRDRYRDH